MALPPSHSQRVLPKPETLVLERIERQEQEFRIFVSTRQPALCPKCGRESHARHSGYLRRLADLPWQGCAVRIWLSVHRYRCRNEECPRKVFCERVPGVAQAYARHTDRLEEVVGAVGYVAGGLPAARLLERLAIQLSDDSVRRRVVSHTMTQPEPVRHLGVDDWAWRKYHTYGTILVDLDRHRVVDLLADRNADSLALWLTQHPTVELITRDRSGLYADGASRGAPQASQVADRFHLVLNLSAAIERVFEGRSRDLVLPSEIGDQPELRPSLTMNATSQQTRQQQRRQGRLDRYQQVAEYYRKGYSKLAIARELAVSIKTVRRWLRADQFPERQSPVGRKKKVAEFAEYLEERWNAGCL